ncbi:P-loop containing nucleoside triphosphate hydrolase protein [Chiua virens]|nr:P-loop containing nucleoside triphosphate hydrolase protein [Chiua virens]
MALQAVVLSRFPENHLGKSEAQQSLEELSHKRDAYQYERQEADESYQMRDKSAGSDDIQNQLAHRMQSHSDDWTQTRMGGETQSPIVDQDQTRGYQAQGQVTHHSKREMVDKTRGDDEMQGQTVTARQMYSHTGEYTPSQAGDEMRSWTSDETQSKTFNQTQIQRNDETQSHVDTRSPAGDEMQGQTSYQRQSTTVHLTQNKMDDQMNSKNHHLEEAKGHDRDQGERSSYQPPVERQEIRTEESLGLMNIENLKASDIVIAVMGPTGSGKSTLVRSITGSETAEVGNGLKSFTSDVRAIRFRDHESGRFVVLVDTPGFDDTYKSDLDILNMISDWLSSSYRKHKLLSGILYLHRITDNRVAGTSLKNLRVFQKLCGDDALKKVYFTTTMWDEVTEEIGMKRLEELKSVYWKPMIDHGAQTFCYGNVDGSPQELVRKIIVADEDCRRVLLQKEMVDLQKEIKETAAGRELYSHLEAIVQKQTDIIQRLNEARVGAKDPRLVLELEGELAALRKQLDEQLLDMEKLKLPRMKRYFSKIRDASSRMIRFLSLKSFLS